MIRTLQVSRDHQQGWTCPLSNAHHLFLAALILQFVPYFLILHNAVFKASYPSYSNNRINQIGWFLCAMEEPEEPVPPIVRARFGLEQRCAYRHADLYDEEVPEAPCALGERAGTSDVLCIQTSFDSNG